MDFILIPYWFALLFIVFSFLIALGNLKNDSLAGLRLPIFNLIILFLSVAFIAIAAAIMDSRSLNFRPFLGFIFLGIFFAAISLKKKYSQFYFLLSTVVIILESLVVYETNPIAEMNWPSLIGFLTNLRDLAQFKIFFLLSIWFYLLPIVLFSIGLITLIINWQPNKKNATTAISIWIILGFISFGYDYLTEHELLSHAVASNDLPKKEVYYEDNYNIWELGLPEMNKTKLTARNNYQGLTKQTISPDGRFVASVYTSGGSYTDYGSPIYSQLEILDRSSSKGEKPIFTKDLIMSMVWSQNDNLAVLSRMGSNNNKNDTLFILDSRGVQLTQYQTNFPWNLDTLSCWVGDNYYFLSGETDYDSMLRKFTIKKISKTGQASDVYSASDANKAITSLKPIDSENLLLTFDSGKKGKSFEVYNLKNRAINGLSSKGATYGVLSPDTNHVLNCQLSIKYCYLTNKDLGHFIQIPKPSAKYTGYLNYVWIDNSIVAISDKGGTLLANTDGKYVKIDNGFLSLVEPQH